MKEKILSIYIPTYNRADKVTGLLRFLMCEIEKIDSKNIEVIVNNNASSDDTEQKVKELIEGSSIIYHKNNENLGIVGNAYMAASLVTGKYVWIIGDDDILVEGIVGRVYDILCNNQNISYVYLNYAKLDEKESPVYLGETCLVKNGYEQLMQEKKEGLARIILTSSSIYLTTCLIETVKNIPLTEEGSYGWSLYASLAAIKKGYSFFDSTVWVYNNDGNASWRNIAYDAWMGNIRSFIRLDKVGYSRKEIKEIYRCWIDKTFLGGYIVAQFLKTRDFRRFFKDYFFCFKQIPIKVIYLSLNIICSELKKQRGGEKN